MSLPNDQTPQKSAASAENIWPPRVAGLRPLTKQELGELVTALEKPVDLKHLEHWVATAVSNVVKLSRVPSPGQAQKGLKRVASEGRKWIEQVDSDPIKALLTQRALQESKVFLATLADHTTKNQQLKVTMARICKLADSAAVDIGRFIRRGGQRPTPPALINFLENMIGIAKSNGIRPSTPQRAMDSNKPPAFFVFVKKALSTAREVIGSSTIPDAQKRRALQSLRYASEDALIRIIERKRGLIRARQNASPWRTRDTISSDILFSSPAKSRREQIASNDARNKCVKNGRLRGFVSVAALHVFSG
jgi:hypothetical protein